MPPGTRAKWPRFHHDVRIRRRHNGDAGIAEQCGGGARSRREAAELVHALPQPPRGLRVEVGIRKQPLRTAEEYRACGQRAIAEPFALSERVEQPAPIVIAQERQQPRRPHQSVQVFGHERQPRRIFGRRARQQLVQQEEVERVHVIVGRLLEMAAVGTHLGLHLLPHDAPARLGPAPGVGEAGKQRAQRVQGHRLAQQVGIGRKVYRQIPFDEAAVPVQGGQEPAAQRFRHLAPRHHPEPRPGQAAERRLEGAGPIDAAQERVLIHPAFQLAERFVQELPPAAQQKGLGQQRQMLMAIQLPDHFVVANPREIEIRHEAEIGSPRGDAVGVIAPPVYVRPCFDGQSEQREAMLQHALGKRQHLRRIGCSTKHIGHPGGIGERPRGGLLAARQPGRQGQHPEIAGLLGGAKADLLGTTHGSVSGPGAPG